MMYFSQLVSTMRNPIIAVAVVEDGGAIQYTGELFDLPFFRFREWHDFKVVDVTPMYADRRAGIPEKFKNAPADRMYFNDDGELVIVLAR